MAPDPLAIVSGALQQAEQAVAEARTSAEERDRENAALRAEVAALKVKCQKVEKELEDQKRRAKQDKASAVRALEEEHRQRMVDFGKDIARAEKAVQDVKTHLSTSVSAPRAEKKPEKKPSVAKVPAKGATVPRKRPAPAWTESSDEDSKALRLKRPKVVLDSDSDHDFLDPTKPRDDSISKTGKAGVAPVGLGNAVAGSSTKPMPGHAGDVSAPQLRG
ncbi:hypothetical protein DFH06DRAFT_1295760 [Mycena polygramma]|nr:hypothetical protein DFH06DRAFT_1295760 [Mycena polygramma]